MLTLYHHPLASFCHKVLIALYENATPFESVVVDLGDPEASAEFLSLWPIGKIPVMRDTARNATVPETSIIIEYLEEHYPGVRPLLPADAAARLEVRLWDRFFDGYVQVSMQKVVTDRLRPDRARDAYGVGEARATLRAAYAMLDTRMRGREWAAGAAFSMADCAAAPALFYAGIVEPLADQHPHAAAYFERLVARPSFQRVLAEARPYFGLFPYRDALPARFLAEA